MAAWGCLKPASRPHEEDTEGARERLDVLDENAHGVALFVVLAVLEEIFNGLALCRFEDEDRRYDERVNGVSVETGEADEEAAALPPVTEFLRCVFNNKSVRGDARTT